jgi:CRP-like cAMP-binding protein
MTQTSQTALSNGQSKLEERLARWLLMCHDRINGDTVELTHEFLSVMLGVRRAGVTVGTHVLEGKGLIRASRGGITILDREGLEEEAQGFYGVPEASYARLIGFDQPAG